MADESARLMNRFVRPIYDAIDARQYKIALKHCAHKKVAHLDLVQVLKAHCLERSGRRDEALAICRSVQRRQPTDDTLLHTMSLVFKLAGCEHEMLPTLEAACAHTTPPSEDLFASLFFAYVRAGDFLKQQQTALKMAKAFGGVRYMSWAALSMLLQVELGRTSIKMLALAERMQLKTLRELASDDGEALQLLVVILQLQHKHGDALSAFDEFATSPVSRSDAVASPGRSAEGDGVDEDEIALGPMLPIDRLVLEASLATAVADYERAAHVYQELLTHHSADDWAFLTGYITVRFDADKDADVVKVEQDVRAFLSTLQAEPKNAMLRGPRLAVIHVLSETLSRLQRTETSAAAAETVRVETQLEEQIGDYMDRFFAKTCCFSDLQQYLVRFQSDSNDSNDTNEQRTVAPATRARLLARVEAMATASVIAPLANDTEDPDTPTRNDALARLHRRLLALQMLRFLGFYTHTSATELTHVAAGLATEYEHAAWLNVGSSGSQREVQNTDNLLLLATHFLLDAAQRSPERQRPLLLHAAALLEHGLVHSAYNFQMKLALARVYSYVAAADAMVARHDELDVKHVQLDALAFLVLDKLLQLCAFPAAHQLVDAVTRVHRSTARDTPEFMARAYKTGVYSKVRDMTHFLHRKMARSHTLAVAHSEGLVLGLSDVVAAGGTPTTLHEHVVSPAFDAAISRLDEVLQVPTDGDTLSQNQHRDVIVRWTSAPTVPSGPTFARDNAPLVECDKSADTTASVRWLQLHAVAAKLLRSAAAGDSTTLVALATEHATLVAQLGLLPSTTADNNDNDKDASAPTLQQRLWRWSDTAVHTTATLAAAINGDDASASALATVPSTFAALQTELAAIAAAFPATLTVQTGNDTNRAALSPYGVSSLSLVVGECGLWTLCLLTTTQRLAAKKKARKDDDYVASVGGLRALLKRLTEFYAALETLVGSLTFGAGDRDSEDGAEGKLLFPPQLAAAQRTVAANVVASYESTQARLTQLLRERVAFTKAK